MYVQNGAKPLAIFKANFQSKTVFDHIELGAILSP